MTLLELTGLLHLGGEKKSTKTILGPTETSAIVSLATCLPRADLMGECLLRLCYLFNNVQREEIFYHGDLGIFINPFCDDDDDNINEMERPLLFVTGLCKMI